MSVKDRIYEIVEAMPETEALSLLETLENGRMDLPGRNGNGQLTFEEKIAEIVRQIPEEEMQKVPADFLDQLDHYIYGTPKR